MAKKKPEPEKMTERDKKYYRLGYDHGHQRLKLTIAKLTTSIEYLAHELMRLDKAAPVSGVVLTFIEAQRLANILEKKGSIHWKKRLEKKIDEGRYNEALFSFLKS